MTITQTVDIPADRRVFFEFLAPKGIPAGPALIELKVIPVIETHDKPLSKDANECATPHTDALLGILSDKPTPLADSLLGIAASLGDITLEQIKDERLAKYLK
jgi:hypothetical protein